MAKMLAGRHILVVEDEMIVLMIIEDMLADLGCEQVSVAATIDHACALIAERSFDAALIDVNLDGRKSYPVADALAAHGVPYAFSTGYSGQSLDVGYRDRPVLGKPYSLGAIQTIFERLIAVPAGR